MSLIIKSNQKSNNPLFVEYSEYVARVEADGGVIENGSMLLDAFTFFSENNIKASDAVSITSVNWGVKYSGGLVVKLYDLFNASGDLTVTSMEVVNDNGVKGLKALSTRAKYAESISSFSLDSVGLFASYKGTSTHVEPLVIAEIWDKSSSFRAVNLVHDLPIGGVISNSFGSSGAVVSRTNQTSFGTVAGLESGQYTYMDGNIIGQDSTLDGTLANKQFKLYVAITGHGVKAGVIGNIFCTIATRKLTQQQAKNVSKFVYNFA